MNLTRTLCIVSTFIIAASAMADWAPLTTGSGNRSITTFNGAIYIAAPPAGVRKSTTDGASWTLANTGLPITGSDVKVQSVGHNATSLFCGTESGIYRSTDNGASWMNVNGTLPASSSTIYCNKIYNFGDATFLVYTGQLMQNGGGVFRSFDNGTTWLSGFSGLASNMVVNGITEMNGVLYAATSTGLMRSADLGGSWTAANNTNWAVQAVQGSNGTLVILGAFGAQHSVNEGQNWTASTGYPTTNCPQGSELALFDGKIYAITKTGASGCFLSSDNGATWAAFNTGLTPQNTFVQEEFHVSSTFLYLVCALDCYRIPSLTTSLATLDTTMLPSPYPTVFADHFQLDMTNYAGMNWVLLIDATGREVSRSSVTGGGIRTIDRGSLAAGRYHCVLLDASTHVPSSLGQVIAE